MSSEKHWKYNLSLWHIFILAQQLKIVAEQQLVRHTKSFLTQNNCLAEKT